MEERTLKKREYDLVETKALLRIPNEELLKSAEYESNSSKSVVITLLPGTVSKTEIRAVKAKARGTR